MADMMESRRFEIWKVDHPEIPAARCGYSRPVRAEPGSFVFIGCMKHNGKMCGEIKDCPYKKGGD